MEGVSQQYEQINEEETRSKGGRPVKEARPPGTTGFGTVPPSTTNVPPQVATYLVGKYPGNQTPTSHPRT